MNRSEIVNALKVIQSVCEENEKGNSGCTGCCFLDDDTKTCLINNMYPCNWLINEPVEKWKALL